MGLFLPRNSRSISKLGSICWESAVTAVLYIIEIVSFALKRCVAFVCTDIPYCIFFYVIQCMQLLVRGANRINRTAERTLSDRTNI